MNNANDVFAKVFKLFNHVYVQIKSIPFSNVNKYDTLQCKRNIGRN